jgi:hypothetical protein
MDNGWLFWGGLRYLNQAFAPQPDMFVGYQVDIQAPK